MCDSRCFGQVISDFWYIDCLRLATQKTHGLYTTGDTKIFHLVDVSKYTGCKDYVCCPYSSGWRNPFCVGWSKNIPKSDYQKTQAPWIIGNVTIIYVKMVAGNESIIHSEKLLFLFHRLFYPFMPYAVLLLHNINCTANILKNLPLFLWIYYTLICLNVRDTFPKNIQV
jgi:hypothetical protein